MRDLVSKSCFLFLIHTALPSFTKTTILHQGSLKCQTGSFETFSVSCIFSKKCNTQMCKLSRQNQTLIYWSTLYRATKHLHFF